MKKKYDPRTIDRQIHSSYVKLTQHFELHVYQNVEQYKNEQVIYYHDLWYFTINDTKRIYDWTLNAAETDKMFQYAIKTYKENEQKARELKKIRKPDMSTLYPNSGSVLVSNNSLVFSSVVIPPNTLKIFDVVTIHSDGRIALDLYEFGSSVKTVPILGGWYPLALSLEQLIEKSDIKSLNHPVAEGIVYRAIDGSTSFKVINNKFLLEEK